MIRPQHPFLIDIFRIVMILVPFEIALKALSNGFTNCQIALKSEKYHYQIQKNDGGVLLNFQKPIPIE